MNTASGPGKTISVLVAEDEELIRKAFCLLVQMTHEIISHQQPIKLE